VIVVEHEMRVVAASDWVVDIGPGAGDEGGRIVATGSPAEVARASKSRTAPYLARFLDDVHCQWERPRLIDFETQDVPESVLRGSPMPRAKKRPASWVHLSFPHRHLPLARVPSFHSVTNLDTAPRTSSPTASTELGRQKKVPRRKRLVAPVHACRLRLDEHSHAMRVVPSAWSLDRPSDLGPSAACLPDNSSPRGGRTWAIERASHAPNRR